MKNSNNYPAREYTYPPKYQREVEDFIRSKGLDFDVDVIIGDIAELARHLSSTPLPDYQFGAMYFEMKDTETYIRKKPYGTLEFVLSHPYKTQIYIREDLPLGSKVRVHVHALGHADFEKANVFFKRGLAFYNSVVSNYPKAKEIISDLLKDKGYGFVNNLTEMCQILFYLSSCYDFDFSYSNHGGWENNPYIGKSRIPESEEGDLLKFFALLPSTPKNIAEILLLYRDYLLYYHYFIKTKVLNEGWATYIESFLPEIWTTILKEYPIQEASLSTTVDNRRLISQYLTKGRRLSDRKIALSSFLKILFQLLTDPYFTGGFFFEHNKKRGEDVLVLRETMTDTDVYAYLLNEDVFYDFIDFALPFEIIPRYKFLKEFSFLYQIFKLFAKSRIDLKNSLFSMKASIPRYGAELKTVNLKVKRPHQSLGVYKFSKNETAFPIIEASIDLEPYMEKPILLGKDLYIVVDIPDLFPAVQLPDIFTKTSEYLKDLVKKILGINLLIMDP